MWLITVVFCSGDMFTTESKNYEIEVSAWLIYIKHTLGIKGIKKIAWRKL